MPRRLSPALLLVVLLTACNSGYGPGLVNRTSRVVKFTAAFSGHHQEIELKPNQAYVQGHPNVNLEALIVKDGDLTKEFGPAELAAALPESMPEHGDRVMIEYLDGGRLHGTTWRQLHK